jgi:hypothetical protein
MTPRSKRLARPATGDPGFVHRLEELGSRFRSRAALAAAADIPASSVQSYLEGSEPTRPALVALAKAGRVSLEWLATGHGHKEPRPAVPDGYAAIPFYDVRKAGGYVYPLVAAEVAEFWFLKLDWFKYPGMRAGELFLVEVTESRVPEVRVRDLVVVDGAWRTKFVDRNPKIPAGVYLVSHQAKLSIRAVSGVSGDVVELVGPHAHGREARLRVGEQGFAIHGRIIWCARALPTPHLTKA